jgi:hypothetical protein
MHRRRPGAYVDDFGHSAVRLRLASLADAPATLKLRLVLGLLFVPGLP